MFKNRKSLWWLCVPYLVYLVCLPFVNRIEPRVGGVTFLTFWMFVGVIITPLSVWLASVSDPLHQKGKKKEG